MSEFVDPTEVTLREFLESIGCIEIEYTRSLGRLTLSWVDLGKVPCNGYMISCHRNYKKALANSGDELLGIVLQHYQWSRLVL